MFPGKNRKNKLWESIKAFLWQGMSPDKLALTVMFGTALGIIPILGVTTVLCAAAALCFRLNMLLIQAINYFVYPLQLLLFIPFIKLGEFLFYGQNVFPFSVGEIIRMAKESWWGTVQQFWLSNLMGVMAWFAVCIPLCLLLYFFTRFISRRYVARRITGYFP